MSDHHQQQQQQQCQQQDGGASSSESVTKTLTRLMSIPSNRSCADCKSPLVDALQVYASYSYNGNNTTATTTILASPTIIFNSFQQTHHQLAPPGSTTNNNTKKRKIPIARDPPVDPAVTASNWCGHGVLLCALCGAAHQLLPRTVTTVAAVHDPTHWTAERVHCLAANGGNARATLVLEAYYKNDSSSSSSSYFLRRPNANSTLADRLTFCRAKYEALAFCLPPAVGPSASDAWKALVQRHPEWKRLWRDNNNNNKKKKNIVDDDDDDDEQDWTLMPSLSGLELKRGRHNNPLYDYPSANRLVQEHQQQARRTAELPDRMVDYFCVVTASDYLHPSIMNKDSLREAQTPEDILLAPHVSDCFPDPNNNNNGDDAASFDSRNNDNDEDGEHHPAFPEHVSTFVFPDGCYASTTALPPTFFTLVLTNAAGERLYGGVLRIYDDCVDTVETLQRVLENSECPEQWRPAWLRQRQQQQQQHQQHQHQHQQSSFAFETPPHPSSSKRTSMDSVHSQASMNSGGGSDVMFLPKCLVILSHYPFFDLWRNFLLQIYRIALTEAPLPMERFVANFGASLICK